MMMDAQSNNKRSESCSRKKLISVGSMQVLAGGMPQQWTEGAKK